MAKKMQGPDSEGYFEFDFELDKFLATVQVQQNPEGVTSTWRVSGPGDLWFPHVLLELELPLMSGTKEELASRCEELWPKFIHPLAVEAKRSGGFTRKAYASSPEANEGITRKHIAFHAIHGVPTFGEGNDIVTAWIYLLAKGFGVKNPIAFVATHFEVPTSTITRRLARARDEGLIPKQRKLASNDD
jgi:hypothetical protein